MVVIFHCRFNVSATCFKGRSKLKCCFDCMPHCLCGLLQIRKANTTFSKYSSYICFLSSAYIVFLLTQNHSLTNRDLILQETMSNEHAMRFPFVGSAMLLSLFLLFKFLSKDLVNAVLTCYFFVLGIIALSYVLLVLPYFLFLRFHTIIGNLSYLFAS